MWHCDRFQSNFGARVAEGGEGKRIATKVLEMTRFLQDLLAEGSGG